MKVIKYCSADTLAEQGLDLLSGQQHQEVLSFLCNDILEGELLRDALQARLEDSGEVKREMGEVVAEKRGELKVGSTKIANEFSSISIKSVYILLSQSACQLHALSFKSFECEGVVICCLERLAKGVLHRPLTDSTLPSGAS